MNDVPFSFQAVLDGHWEFYHDDDCGAVLDPETKKCSACGWRPDMQSMGARRIKKGKPTSNEIDQKLLYLLSTTDAMKWAQAFKETARKLYPQADLDEGWLVGWFANAIETARRITERKYEGNPTEHPFWRVGKKPFADKTDADKVMLTAILLLSTRGDVYLAGPEGEDVPCSALTMEGIFERLKYQHDEKLMAHTR